MPRGSNTGRATVPLLIGLGLLGVGLAALPWLDTGRPMSLPPEIAAGSSEQGELQAVARAVDEACSRGDVPGLRALVTTANWAQITTWMTGAGRALDPEALKEQGYFVGDVASLPFVCGVAGGDRAVLVFYRTRATLPANAARGSLFALVFWWDGQAFLLDGKHSEPLAPADDRVGRGREWAGQLLGENSK